MRILHIMYGCGLRGGGGAASAATRLHLDLLRQGIDSRVVCVWGDSVGVEKVSVLRTWWWWWRVRFLHAVTRRWTHWIDLPGFDRLVQDFKPDEIHVHWINRDTISWRQLARMKKFRVFVHLHDLWPLEQECIVSLEPTFVGYSDYVVNEVRKCGYKVERRRLLLDKTFEDNEAVLGRRSSRTSPKRILFGCNNGRMNPDKGFVDLTAALALLPGDLKGKIELRIFGEGPCGAVADTSGVRTVLLGRIDEPEKLKDEYMSATCFAFPSTRETMGMTKLEALSCGCPVIAFDRTACAEGIEHLRTGYVARDILDYARGLIWGLND